MQVMGWMEWGGHGLSSRRAAASSAVFHWFLVNVLELAVDLFSSHFFCLAGGQAAWVGRLQLDFGG